MIARVFPRQTNTAPDDGLAFFEPPPRFLPPFDEIHVSVAFSYDMEQAEKLLHITSDNVNQIARRAN